jgi:hypothetical protein
MSECMNRMRLGESEIGGFQGASVEVDVGELTMRASCVFSPRG